MRKKAHQLRQGAAKVCKSAPKVSKMDPKWRSGTLPKLVFRADRGENSEYAICTLFAMFQRDKPLWKSTVFAASWALKSDENGVPHRGRQKALKIEAPGGTMAAKGVHIVLQGSPGRARMPLKSFKKESKNLSSKGDRERA